MSGICLHTETVGFNLTEEEVEAVASLYDNDQTALLKFRIKSATGMDWNDDISAVEVKGMLQAIELWRAKKASRN